jgi:hypothetical protein
LRIAIQPPSRFSWDGIFWRSLPPGPEFGRILHAAYEAQLDGHFTDLDGALSWLSQHETRATGASRKVP